MDFAVRTSLGILLLLALVVDADLGKSFNNFNAQCQVRGKRQNGIWLTSESVIQALKCNPSTEICRVKPKCDDSKSECIYCASKDDSNQKLVSKTIVSEEQPLAPRLLAKSGGKKLLADNHGDSISTTTNTNTNETSDELTYDDYYEYGEEESPDKNEFGEEDEYLDDYAEPSDSFIKGSGSARKLGRCPRILATNDRCDLSTHNQSDCQLDADCPGDQKCCESACNKRVCNTPITSKND